MNETECKYEELVSGLVDGELTVAEEVELREHLSGCDSCLLVLQKFRALDRQIHDAHIPIQPALLGESTIRHSVSASDGKTPKSSARRFDRNRRALLAGGTAVALAGIAAAVAISQSPTESVWIANTSAGVESMPKVQDVVAPLSRLAENNQKSRRQQEYLARSLRLQLRTLKLTARNSTSDANRLQQLESEIDDLLKQLNTDYAVPDALETGATPAL